MAAVSRDNDDESPESSQHLRDRIYAQPCDDVAAFRFDDQVATVFADMIGRSVPGYSDVLAGLTDLARRFIRPGDVVYDLGCSLGAATQAVLAGITSPAVRVIAVDSSSAMAQRARERLASFRHPASVVVEQADIATLSLETAGMVVLNYTLQFIAPDRREHLCQGIFDQLRPGGAFVLSEKIRWDDEPSQQLIDTLHEQFKRKQGYSELEIAQKRAALEGVLVAETREQHIARLRNVGFMPVVQWMQHLNFVSFVAVKPDEAR